MGTTLENDVIDSGKTYLNTNGWEVGKHV